MCGIIGYVGPRPVLPVLLDGLKRLEYRGYDSAGVAFFVDSKIEILKSEGKLANVEKMVNGKAIRSNCGMGHTRWATHGKPTTQNAHPHRTGSVVLVHNGIIENYHEIREEVLAKGFEPVSETDSELFGFLVVDEMKRGTEFREAVRKSFLRLQGACSVVVLCEQAPGVVIGIRNGPPLIAAVDPEGGALLASDAQAVLSYTKDIYFLDNGQGVVGNASGLEFFSIATGKTAPQKSHRITWSAEQMEKQGFAHFMLKEIHEQPQTMVDTINSVLDRSTAEPFVLAQQPGVNVLNAAQELVFSACGSSWHAAQLGRFWLEKWGGKPCSVELSSEYRYRHPVVRAQSAIVGISQSGETADTLAVIRDFKQKNPQAQNTLAVTNCRESTLSREAFATFYTSAGPEIGVAATKTFLSQALMFLLWAGHLAKQNRDPEIQRKRQELFDELLKLPHLLTQSFLPGGQLSREIQVLSDRVHDKKGFFFIGRGYNFPLALEGALKLKEIAYTHAEGFAAGELKHGPIAMIDSEMVVVVIAPPDAWRDKTVSNLQEVKARGALIVGLGAESDKQLKSLCDEWISVPHLDTQLQEDLYPFLIAPVLQLFAYFIALKRGTDIDQPRNLAKSVTVE